MFILGSYPAVGTVAYLGVLSAVMELLQNVVEGRHSQMMDSIFSTAGAGTGVFFAIFVFALANRIPRIGKP
jgi:VanZ family protein